jgi:A/G-specific adenine glycosylase
MSPPEQAVPALGVLTSRRARNVQVLAQYLQVWPGEHVHNPRQVPHPLHQPLLEWYAREGRDLPWRRTKDPYAIWVSEVMLQQTQVKTALPYYGRWMRRFPDVRSLAEADEQDALAIWQGLGYYRRCRMLLTGARWVAEHGMPQTRDAWIRVPGVGPYTAAAIASICFGEPAAVVDGNVTRVFARLTASAESGSRLAREAWAWADEVLQRSVPADWNQAMMELGARVCTPRRPRCGDCPVSNLCRARSMERQEAFPVRAKKPETVILTFKMTLPTCSGRLGVRRIEEGAWWRGMWEFPRFESVEDAAAFWGQPVQERSLGVLRHTVTRHRLVLDLWAVHLTTPDPRLHWHSFEELRHLPMPAMHRKALARLVGG